MGVILGVGFLFLMRKPLVSNCLVVVGSMPPLGSSFGVHEKKPNSFYIEESSKLKKVNGCLPRSHDHPILVIPPKSVMEDVDYWS